MIDLKWERNIQRYGIDPPIKHRTELYKLLPDKCIVVELGTAEGYSASDMCLWLNLKKIYVVDAWRTLSVVGDGGYNQEWHNKNYEAAMNRLEPFNDKVEVLRGITYLMADHVNDNSIDLLYIDADHSYEGVMKDLDAWYPKVKSGGVVAGHDFLNLSYGVNRAAKEFSLSVKAILFTIPEHKAEDAGFYFIKP